MSIKTKVSLIAIAAILAGIGLNYGVQRLVVIPSFTALERREAAENLQRCTGIIEREIRDLDALCADRAARSSTYEYIENRSQTYAEKSLNAETFRSKRIDLLLLVDDRHRLVWGQTANPRTGDLQPVDRPRDLLLASTDQLLTQPMPASYVRGLVRTKLGHMLISARPIITGEHQGPVRGTLLMGRLLDGNLLKNFSEQTFIPFQCWSLEGEPLPQEQAGILKEVESPEAPPHIVARDGNALYAYARMAGVGGAPGILLRTEARRDISAEGEMANRLALLSFAIGSCSLLLLVSIVLQKVIIKPLSRLTEHVSKSKRYGHMAPPLRMRRTDEIGLLANAFDRVSELQRQLLATTATAIFTVDNRGIITDANDELCRVTGYGRDKLVGQPCSMLEGESCQHSCGLSGPERKEPILRRQCTIHTKDGRPLSVLKNADHIRDDKGAIVGGIVCFVDVTAQKKAEEAACREAAKLSSMISGMEEGVIFASADNLIVEVNDYFCRFAGKRREEVLGRRLEDLHPDEIFDLLLAQIGRFREKVRSDTFVLQRPFGQAEVVFRMQPVYRDEEYEGVLLNVIDVTQLVKAHQQAEAATAAKSDFLARMSHEIRTPLNGVIGMAHLLMVTELTPQQKRYAQIVKTSADALLALINDILDFSKIEAGKLELRPSDFSLPTVVEEVVEMFAQRAAEKDIELAAVIEPSVPPMVGGDSDRFRQILVNLVGNAIKFTDHGEVLIRAEHAGQMGGKTRVRVTVRDTGIGISEEDVGRLFRSFSQVDTSNTRKYGGTGLGLAISKWLVEMMGGQIGVQSQKGKGSAFWFTIEFEACEQPVAQCDPDAPDLRGLRVLVVDDSAASRQVVCEQLSSWGICPDMAADGRAALEMLRQRTAEGKPFRIVILDAQVLDMSGPALSLAIRDDPHIRKNVRIVTTPMDGPLDSETMAAAGITSCLTQPVRQSRLFDAIVEALARDAGSPWRPVPKAAAAPSLAAIAKFRGALILLAEDNEINQILATEILKVAGYRCEVVCNGQEAVAALLKKPFDLVLMDCQMPEMDGLEATRQIRRKEREAVVLSKWGGRIPIIALTANAIGGERERCLEAGMDEYLSKPIVPEEMIRTIESALSSQAAPGPSTPAVAVDPAPPFASPADGPPPFDLDELLQRCMGNRDFMAKMLDKFAPAVGDGLERAEESVSQGDLDTAAKVAHMLKGMGANLSAQGVRQAAVELEHACRAGCRDGATKALSQLRAEVCRCRDQMPEIMAEALPPLTGRAAGGLSCER